MKSELQVKGLCPTAFLFEHRGTFVGGRVRYEVKTGPRKVIGMGMRRDWAWADALRNLQAPRTHAAGRRATRAAEASPVAERCSEVERLRAQVAALRTALAPLARGTHWITDADVERARTALGVSP